MNIVEDGARISFRHYKNENCSVKETKKLSEERRCSSESQLKFKALVNCPHTQDVSQETWDCTNY